MARSTSRALTLETRDEGAGPRSRRAGRGPSPAGTTTARGCSPPGRGRTRPGSTSTSRPPCPTPAVTVTQSGIPQRPPGLARRPDRPRRGRDVARDVRVRRRCPTSRPGALRARYASTRAAPMPEPPPITSARPSSVVAHVPPFGTASGPRPELLRARPYPARVTNSGTRSQLGGPVAKVHHSAIVTRDVETSLVFWRDGSASRC